eukprot:m.14024 g.14024  ORF g.14024 m.14024 type:complete len:867 (-) comp4969_c0_seq1:62-2662(-)
MSDNEFGFGEDDEGSDVEPSSDPMAPPAIIGNFGGDTFVAPDLTRAKADAFHGSQGSPRDSPGGTMFRRRLNRSQDLDESTFREEDGSETSITTDRAAFLASVILENPETETRWYFRYFLGRSHQNFLSALTLVDDDNNTELEPVLLSILCDEDGSIRAILWRKSGTERLLTKGQRGKAPDAKKVLTAFGHGIPERRVTEVKDPNLQDELLVVEEQEGAVNFKIGVLYAKAGQTTDDEMFSNEHGSSNFEEFYKTLGQVKALQGFTGFRGGLDVKNGSTGEYCVHTVEYGKEIIFHVSTLLPYSQENSQQLERKRHLGNDICNIIYLEDINTEFKPEMIKSKFNHIFAVVSPLGSKFTLKVFTRNTVPEYGPPLPNPCIFNSLAELRHFLIVKLLNGEKAALGSPVSSFAQKKRRTLEMLIQSIHEKFDKVPKRTLTRATPKGNKQRAEVFRSQGQTLKVTKIAAGVAPTSTLSNLPSVPELQNEPWTPLCVTSKLEPNINVGDSWGRNFLIATPFGINKLTVARHEAGMIESEQLADSSVLVKQMKVDEASGMLFLLTVAKLEESDENLKPGTVYGIPLEHLASLDTALNKKTLKPFTISNSKGCHLFAVNSTMASTASLLRQTVKLALAVGKKIKTYQLMARNPYGTVGRGHGGVLSHLNDLACPDVILAMNVTNQGGTGLLCVAFKSGEFVLMNLEGLSMSSIKLAGTRAVVDPVACLSVPNIFDEDVVDFVICYNQFCVFRDEHGEKSREYDIKFSSRPHAIAYVYPYLLGFTEDSIEVVTLINGSLVKTIPMPRCKFLTNNRGVFFCSRSDDKMQLYKISHEALSGKSALDDSLESLEDTLVLPGNVFARRLSGYNLSENE